MFTVEELSFIHGALMSTQFQGGAMRKAGRVCDKIEAMLAPPKQAAPVAQPQKPAAQEPKIVAPGEPVEALA